MQGGPRCCTKRHLKITSRSPQGPAPGQPVTDAPTVPERDAFIQTYLAVSIHAYCATKHLVYHTSNSYNCIPLSFWPSYHTTCPTPVPISISEDLGSARQLVAASTPPFCKPPMSDTAQNIMCVLKTTFVYLWTPKTIAMNILDDDKGRLMCT